MIVALMWCLSHGKAHSQGIGINKIHIDTVKYNYKIAGIIELESMIPQLRSEIKTLAIDKINNDLKTYFDAAAVKDDSATYIRNLLENYDIQTLEELQKHFSENEEQQRNQSFTIEFFGENIINISISGYLYPRGGKQMFWFDSPCYDLLTGEKLLIRDFISLDKQTLIQDLASKGYCEQAQSEGEPTRSPVDTIYTEVTSLAEYIQGLYSRDSTQTRCVHFYFNNIDNEVHLRIVSECNGPAWAKAFIYGIPLRELTQYLIYPHFKNTFRLWGEDIHNLIGKKETIRMDSIVFDNYTVRNGGGYMLPPDSRFPDQQFGVSYYNSDSSLFRMFIKWVITDSSKTGIVTDVLEIKREDLKTGEIIVEQSCSSKINDPEIIAVVRKEKIDQEFYSKIKMAWRSNRKTGKFEKIRARKVKKCYNETYGI